MDLRQWVDNPYIGHQQCFCFNRILTPEDRTSYINNLEEITGLKFQGKLPVEMLNGFVTMAYQTGYCPWGNHAAVDGHTSIIVSLYGRPKPFGIEGIEHEFVETPITEELAQQLDKAYRQAL